MNAILPRPACRGLPYADHFPRRQADLRRREPDGSASWRAWTANRLSARLPSRRSRITGAQSPLESALMEAFDKGRNRIRSVCAEALDQNNDEGVILHSGLFRVEGHGT